MIDEKSLADLFERLQSKLRTLERGDAEVLMEILRVISNFRDPEELRSLHKTILARKKKTPTLVFTSPNLRQLRNALVHHRKLSQAELDAISTYIWQIIPTLRSFKDKTELINFLSYSLRVAGLNRELDMVRMRRLSVEGLVAYYRRIFEALAPEIQAKLLPELALRVLQEALAGERSKT